MIKDCAFPNEMNKSDSQIEHKKLLKVIGHRGFKGLCQENTIFCYDKAVEAGAELIETDLQMTKDGKIVMHHDSDTERLWDKSCIIGETSLSDLLELRSKTDPDTRITTFKDALKWLLKHPNMKFILDIKPVNNKLILIRAFNEIRAVLDDLDFWRERLIIGLWKLDWFKEGVATGVLKGFPIVAISLSVATAKPFIEYANQLDHVSYRLHGVSIHFINTWKEDFKKFDLPYLNENNLSVYVWTVNREVDLRCAVSLPIDGVIADNPSYIISLRDKYVTNPSPFIPPLLSTKEGLRFYVGRLIFDAMMVILHSQWTTTPIFKEISISSVFVMFMRRLHFV